MSYRIDLGEPAEAELRRCTCERIAHAIAQLEERLDDEPETAIHEARKDVKKARALLRLYRKPLGRETFRRENRALRDAGRELSSVRDAHVIDATVDALVERYAGRVAAGDFAALRDDGADPPEHAPAMAAGEARERLGPALARISDCDLAGMDAGLLVDALRRMYARGRRASRAALDDPSDERLHAWRKRVKDLRYQQRLLRDAWPDVMNAQAKAAKVLSDVLGDDHDLAVLQARADASPELAELIAARREELQAAAFGLGRRVYAERPKRFSARVGRYVRARAEEAGRLSAA